MRPTVLIPSCKPYHELMLMVEAVKSVDKEPFDYCPTGYKTSAAVNRNIAIEQAKSDIVIMMDDDIGGFYPNWQKDLVKPLLDDRNIRMVSARLITPEGANSPMMFSKYSTAEELEEVKPALLSACIAFRTVDVKGLFFDMNFIGSGFEDTDFCFQLGDRFPSGLFVINNKCRMIHYHEMKAQSENYNFNRDWFMKKWGGDKRLAGVAF